MTKKPRTGADIAVASNGETFPRFTVDGWTVDCAKGGKSELDFMVFTRLGSPSQPRAPSYLDLGQELAARRREANDPVGFVHMVLDIRDHLYSAGRRAAATDRIEFALQPDLVYASESMTPDRPSLPALHFILGLVFVQENSNYQPQSHLGTTEADRLRVKRPWYYLNCRFIDLLSLGVVAKTAASDPDRYGLSPENLRAVEDALTCIGQGLGDLARGQYLGRVAKSVTIVPPRVFGGEPFNVLDCFPDAAPCGYGAALEAARRVLDRDGLVR